MEDTRSADRRMTEGMPAIGVVIPVRNGARTIVACLDALLAAGRRWPSPVALVVVDNGSTDDTVRIIRKRYTDRVIVLEDPAHTIGSLRNLGAESLQSDLLCFTDADCVVAEDHFEVAWRALRTTGASAVGSPYALPPDPGWIERTWDAMHQPPTEGSADWLYAGNMVIRTDVFRSVGGFPEFLPTGEDPELGRRLRKAGFALHCDPSLVAVHLGNPRTLSAFFRQQWWHGLGALAPGLAVRENKPLVMTLLLMAMTIGWMAAWASGLLKSGVAILSGIAASQALVPLATVAFRIRQGRRRVNPLAGIVLYWLYYWGRIAALASVTVGFPKPPRGRT